MDEKVNIVATQGANPFRCIITDGISYINVEFGNWSHQAEWVGTVFCIEFQSRKEAKCTVVKFEKKSAFNNHILHVDDLGNHDPLKMAVLRATYKGPPVQVEYLFIYLDPPF